jgi:hypothetical protein
MGKGSDVGGEGLLERPSLGSPEMADANKRHSRIKIIRRQVESRV